MKKLGRDVNYELENKGDFGRSRFNLVATVDAWLKQKSSQEQIVDKLAAYNENMFGNGTNGLTYDQTNKIK